MTHETLVCVEGVPTDQLSALRDEALPAAEAERLREHIASCAACRARLADFDALASTLRGQRELDPGDRILEGVHARLARRSGPARSWRDGWNAGGRRRMLAGLAALAPVAAIILLFVYVFASIGQHPSGGSTPTVGAGTATPSAFTQVSPTATTQITYTQSIPASQAWPGFKPAFDVAFTGSQAPTGWRQFIPSVLSPDLTAIGGVVYVRPNAAPQPPSPPVQLAYYTIATGKITTLGPTWKNAGTGPWGGMLSIDSRFIVYGYNSQPGATCGVCHSTLWSLDRTTGATWQFNAQAGGDLVDDISDDHVAFTSGTTGQVWVADLAAHTVKVALPVGSKPYSASTQPSADERLLGFQWPYLLYAETPAATPPAQSATTLNVLDMATGVNIQITSQMFAEDGVPLDPGSVTNMALVGRTLYANVMINLSNGVRYGALYRLDDYTSSDKFIAVAFWPLSDNSTIDAPTMANRHLVWLGSGYFWDNAELRMVSAPFTNSRLVGSYITTIEGASPSVVYTTYHVLAYDTSSFPTPPGW